MAKSKSKKLNDTASYRAHMPEGTDRILNTRSLASSHRRLSDLLRLGMAVLDVGCGTGAITRGIAEAVGEEGRVAGLDTNTDLIDQARQAHSGIGHLSFEAGDLNHISYVNTFDIVTASRVLQWLSQPDAAIRHMVAAVRPGGLVLVLDYNHEKIEWTPGPPTSMQAFYDAFLRWRSDAGMDNTVADHLPELFSAAGLTDIITTPQHEITHRQDDDFTTRIGIWADVAATRGHQMVADGYLTEAARASAETEYRGWVDKEAERQVMYLVAVEGRKILTD